MKRTFWLLATLLLLLGGCMPRTVNLGGAGPQAPQLVVQAEGQLQVNPDQLQLRLGVVSEAGEAGAALEQNNRQMTAVLQMLQELGLSAEELATGQFQIRPEWSVPPRPTPANWQRKIVGYRVSNELLVTTGRLELAGKLLSLAQQAGANQIGGLQFRLSDPSTYRQQAITLATEKAIRKAQTMAAAAEVELGPIQSLSLGSNSVAPQPRMMLAEARSVAADAVPVAAGKVEVSESVTIVYRLLPAKP